MLWGEVHGMTVQLRQFMIQSAFPDEQDCPQLNHEASRSIHFLLTLYYITHQTVWSCLGLYVAGLLMFIYQHLEYIQKYIICCKQLLSFCLYGNVVYMHLFHLFLCKSEMNPGQFSNHHGSLIIVSNHFFENQKVILQIFWENKCTVTSGIGVQSPPGWHLQTAPALLDKVALATRSPLLQRQPLPSHLSVWYMYSIKCAIICDAKSTPLAFRGSTPNWRYWPQRLKVAQWARFKDVLMGNSHSWS